MRPTSRAPRPRAWGRRRGLAERLLGSKRPLQTLHELQELHELQARSLHELRALQRLHIDWPHVARPDFIFYTPKQIQHLIRLESALGHATAAPGAPREARAPPSALAPYEYRQESPGGQSASRPWSEWGNLATGWVAGAVLLLAALLLVRYVDRCLARKLLGLRRRQSEEWPTPTVLATSRQRPADGDGETAGAGGARDPPPPYSECAASSGAPAPAPRPAGKPPAAPAPEEPPPPYSACYVAFTDPKRGGPSVSFFNEHGQSFGNEQQSAMNEDATSLRTDPHKADGCDSAGSRAARDEARRELC